VQVNIKNLIDDGQCYQTVRELRWPDGVECPACQSKHVIKRGFDDTEPARQRYECTDTSSLQSEYMHCFHQIGIARERCHGLRRVTTDNARNVLTQHLQIRVNCSILDIDTVLQSFPEPLDGMHLRAIRGQPDEHDIGWHRHALGAMGWGLIQQDDVQALRIPVATVVQNNGAARGVQAGALPPEGVACRRFHRCIEPIVRIKWLHDLDGLHPIARHAARRGQVQPEATCILTKEAHRLAGVCRPNVAMGSVL
jgi:Transposase zinc-ribbon domain